MVDALSDEHIKSKISLWESTRKTMFCVSLTALNILTWDVDSDSMLECIEINTPFLLYKPRTHEKFILTNHLCSQKIMEYKLNSNFNYEFRKANVNCLKKTP